MKCQQTLIYRTNYQFKIQLDKLIVRVPLSAPFGYKPIHDSMYQKL